MGRLYEVLSDLYHEERRQIVLRRYGSPCWCLRESMAPHVSVEGSGERDNLSFFEGLDGKLEEDCSLVNTAIRASRSSHS